MKLQKEYCLDNETKNVITREDYVLIKKQAFKKANAPYSDIDKDNYREMMQYMPTELILAVVEERVIFWDFGKWSEWFVKACHEELIERELLGYK